MVSMAEPFWRLSRESSGASADVWITAPAPTNAGAPLGTPSLQLPGLFQSWSIAPIHVFCPRAGVTAASNIIRIAAKAAC